MPTPVPEGRGETSQSRRLTVQRLVVTGESGQLKILMTPDGQAIDLRQDPDVTDGALTQTSVGLDHVGFVCRDRAELDAWETRLGEFGAYASKVEESPFGWHLNFRDPDGIPLEFFLPRSSS